MALEGLNFLARRRIPDAHRVVEACRGDVPAVRAERHAEGRVAVRKVANLLRGRDIPHPYEPISSRTHRQAPSIGAVSHPHSEAIRGTGQRVEFLAAPD